MTPGIISPFSQVECPVCSNKINISADRDKLYRHIKDNHKNEALVPIAESIYVALHQSIPDNLHTISFADLVKALANACKDATNKLGSKELRGRLRRK